MPRPSVNTRRIPTVTSADQDRSWGRPLAAVCAVALVSKLIILLQLSDHPLLHPDSGLDTTAYAELARRVVNGDLWLGPGLYYLSPLYIYSLALGLVITDSFTGVRVLQVIAGTGAIAAIWVMTRWFGGVRAAWWASGLAIATGVLTFYEVLILQASVDTALTAGALLALGSALRTERPWAFVTAGAVFGLAALNRPNMILVLGGLLLLLAVLRRWRPTAALMVGALIAFAPVAIRNGLVAGQWFTVSSHGGLNLYIGNGPGATGFYRVLPGITPNIAGQARDTRQVAGAALGRTVTDAEASDYFTDLALTWMVEQPGAALALFLKKFAFSFHGTHVALPYSYPFYVHETDAWLRWLPAGPWLLMPLGLVGLGILAMSDRSASTRIWLSFVPLYAAAVAVFFVADRYRLPLLVPMCIGSGIALDRLSRVVREQRWTALTIPGGAFVVLFLLVNAPASLNDGRWAEGLKLAQRFVILGQDDEARRWTERLAVDADPRGSAHHLVGRQYLVEGRASVALPYLRDAVSAGLNNSQVLVDLATAADAVGDAAEARGALARLSAPDDTQPAELWLRLGRLAGRLLSPADADRFFAHAVRLDPAGADGRLQYGVNLVLLQRLPDAREQLAVAVDLNPRLVDAQAYLAYCEASLGDLDAARRRAEAALALDPAHQIARSVLASLK